MSPTHRYIHGLTHSFPTRLSSDLINTAQDLQGRVPSLVISPTSQMRNTESPTIRGQGAQFGAGPGVVIYMAEVPLPSDPVANNQGGPGKFLDLSNLQIGREHVGTPVTNAHLVCRLLLEKKN